MRLHMGQLKAAEKLERLLAMIPWIIDNDGPQLDLIAKRFEYPEELLLTDLTKVLFMVGPYPHTPDTLIEVIIEDGRVWIDQADWLSRPIRLTPEQGFNLLRKAKTLELIHNQNETRALSSAIEKLEVALGQSKETFELDISEIKNTDLLTINESIREEKQLRIRYYAYGKDESSTRIVHPLEIINRDHCHYLHAYCEVANDYRLFRLDRILEVETIDKSNLIPEADCESLSLDEKWNLDASGDLITLKISHEDSWILSTYPIEEYSQNGNGDIEVRLVVAGIAWLKRLLLRLSPTTEIIESPEHIPADLARQAAMEITNRYKENL
ncbi:MAG: hypothetical protein CL522_01360 [Actinobacteria bacterium]|nr:hypothetical protein [Actinomycetota bacterium]